MGLPDVVDIPKCLRKKFTDAKNDRNKQAKGFTLTWGHVCDLWIKQRGRCWYCSHPFNLKLVAAFVKQPLGISFDRIHDDHGYHDGKIRLAHTQCNMARGQWGDELFFDMCRAVASSGARDQ
jgi:hypothetical protein